MKTTTIGFLLPLFLLTGCRNEREEIYRDLKSASVIRRAGAVRILWRLGDEQAYRILSTCLDDESLTVRLAAVNALADFKKIDTFQALVRASHNQEKRVRSLAFEKIAALSRPESREILLNALAVHEPDAENRALLSRLLRQQGLGPEEQSREISIRSVQNWLAVWPNAPLVERTRMARLAARMADERSLEVVRFALEDRDSDVVAAALEAINGRGGKEILRLLARLYSQRPEFRQALLREFIRYGQEGGEFVLGGLYSSDQQIRKLARSLLTDWCQANFRPEEEVSLCSANTYPREENLAPEEMTADFSSVPLDISAVEKFLEKAPSEISLAAAVHFLSKGVAAPRAIYLVKKRKEQILQLLRMSREDWIGGRILPLEKAPQSVRQEGPPRSTQDLLSRLGTRQEIAYYHRLFPALSEEIVEETIKLTRAWLVYRLEDGPQLLGELLRAPSADLVARAVKLAGEFNVRVELQPTQEDNLTTQLNEADPKQSALLGRFIAERGTPRLLKKMLTEINSSSWEKSRQLILALEGNSSEEVIETLEKQLERENAATAALILARSGRCRAEFKKLLDKASGEAKLEIIEALIICGDNSILPHLEAYLFDPEPDTRIRALDIIKKMESGVAEPLLELAHWDIDRLVRDKALAISKTRAKP